MSPSDRHQIFVLGIMLLSSAESLVTNRGALRASVRRSDWPHACTGYENVPVVPTNHRAGFVSILGIPNVGKSTLMNALIGEQLSIATSKPQTTRQRIMGILNGDDYQIVCSDTPGVLLPQYKLQEGMMRFVRSSINDADVLMLVVDVFQTGFPDEQVLRQLRGSSSSLLVLVNKVDLLSDGSPLSEQRRAELGTVEELLQRWRSEFPDATVLPLSARKGEGIDDILSYILALMPKHPPYFPKDELSDKPERFFAAEFLREAIFEHYREEIPYSCEVEVSSFKESDKIIRIGATIYVSHDRYVFPLQRHPTRPNISTRAS